MNCPNCNEATLINIDYESVEIDQCRSCHGIWLDQNEIGEIVKNRVTDFSQKEIIETVKMAFAGIPTKLLEESRKCPKCSQKLKTINYSTDSGIMIDICPDEHGIWLDNHELESIQQYREYWQDNVYKYQDKLFPLISNIKNDDKPKKFYSIFFNLSMLISEKVSRK